MKPIKNENDGKKSLHGIRRNGKEDAPPAPVNVSHNQSMLGLLWASDCVTETYHLIFKNFQSIFKKPPSFPGFPELQAPRLGLFAKLAWQRVQTDKNSLFG